ncbi:MAG: TOMM precursor leader peptide-binding protein [Actinobacteria bacterium]|nr:TOMM precursor leader peptide-binding protein [Actinomycetota bacterium]
MGRPYVVDPAWSFTRDGDTFMVRGGADQLFALEDVPDDLAGALLAPPVLRPPAPAAGAGIFDQLVMLGALRPEIVAPGRLLATSLVWSGDPVDGVAEGVAAQLASAELVDGSGSLVVYVRTTATLGETAGLAADGPPVAHLLVDAAYHHTLSLGPLVVPGDTACLSCLVMRVWPSWGDERPPPRPAATQRPGLLAAVIAGEIEKVAVGDTGLVNRTVAIDLSTWRTTEGTLLKAPWCPVCCPVDAP